MIPMIGLMVGAYIITRCLSFLTRTGDHKESGLVVAFAVLTILITLFVIYGLFTSGADISSILK